MAPVLKTGDADKASEGSNPSPSANLQFQRFEGCCLALASLWLGKTFSKLRNRKMAVSFGQNSNFFRGKSGGGILKNQAKIRREI